MKIEFSQQIFEKYTNTNLRIECLLDRESL